MAVPFSGALLYFRHTMPPTFFEHQARAKRNTSLLLGLYLLSIFCLIAAIYLGLAMITHLGSGTHSRAGLAPNVIPSLWNPELFMIVTAVLLLLIACGSLYKVFQLREGGAAVARMLGGRLLQPNTSDPAERRVINIVEEIAIASGMKVPPVYVLDKEKGINAFAAGFSPGEAVVAVSRGAIDFLTRDELQGVIGHEFSHILNGDMGLNIRLIGILHGILVIALSGYTLMRVGYYSSRPRSSSKDDRSMQSVIVLGGIVLCVAGYIGVFFAKLIKSAVSRQREYLADASAVQFTRNPSGIAGALKKIGGLIYGSRLDHPRAQEASHMYFSDGMRQSLLSLFSTHPPLTERIKRIEPGFNGDFPKISPQKAAIDLEEEPSRSAFSKTCSEEPASPTIIMASVGTTSHFNLEAAKSILRSIPADVATRAHDTCGATALIYCVLLSAQPAVRARQLEALQPRLDQGMQREMRGALKETEQLAPLHKLPLVDLSLPALKLLSKDQYLTFKENVRILVQTDEALDPFEFTLQRILLRHLDPFFLGKRATRIRHRSLETLVAPASDLLFALAFLGNGDAETAMKAYSAGCEACGIHPDLRRRSSQAAEASIQLLDRALRELCDIEFKFKEPILKACIACIAADQSAAITELELLRAVADALDCPMPPINSMLAA